MSDAAVLPRSSNRMESLRDELGDIPVIDDPLTVKRKSRDFFWYSPILNASLATKFGDLIVSPRDEADVLRVAAACARHGVPITPRGGGTGNYGQAVPLEGGVILDVTTMTNIVARKPGVVSVEPGARMVDIDRELRPGGWELRMHPSTKRTATIGGFVAGGSGGVGSVTYGGLREPANILGARVVTVEREPRVIELTADAAQKVNRAYGTTGIITRLDMPLAPAWDWVDFVVAFDDFEDAVRVGLELALADGIVKKLVTPIAWPLPRYFGPLRGAIPDGKSILICMIAEPWIAYFRDLLGGRGRIVHQAASDDSPANTPIYEYTWNHTTLQVLKADRAVTYLQSLYPHDRILECVRLLREVFGDEQMSHLEFLRFGGRVTVSGLPVVRYTTPARLNEIISIYEANGIMIANPHVHTLEDGSRHKRADADQLGFKHEVDPLGLLNPGKMRSFAPRQEEIG